MVFLPLSTLLMITYAGTLVITAQFLSFYFKMYFIHGIFLSCFHAISAMKILRWFIQRITVNDLNHPYSDNMVLYKRKSSLEKVPAHHELFIIHISGWLLSQQRCYWFQTLTIFWSSCDIHPGPKQSLGHQGQQRCEHLLLLVESKQQRANRTDHV